MVRLTCFLITFSSSLLFLGVMIFCVPKIISGAGTRFCRRWAKKSMHFLVARYLTLRRSPHRYGYADKALVQGEIGHRSGNSGRRTKDTDDYLFGKPVLLRI